MATLEIQILDSHDKDILCDYYEKIKKEGLLDVFLYEDSSLYNFIDFCHKQWIYLCLLDGIPAGITFFNNFCGKSAFFHFCMFKNGIPYTLEFGKMIFDTVYRNNDLEIIFGLTPRVYRHVFPVLHAIGMQKLISITNACKVGNKAREGIVSYITRERFYELILTKKESKNEDHNKDCL